MTLIFLRIYLFNSLLQSRAAALRNNYSTGKNSGVLSSTFVKLILDRNNFIEINLVKINFEEKWFIFDNSSKSDSDRK